MEREPFNEMAWGICVQWTYIRDRLCFYVTSSSLSLIRKTVHAQWRGDVGISEQ